MNGDHTYWLQHESGDKTIGGQNYFQGNSYYSFFGDPDKFSEPTLFTNVDRTSFPSLDYHTVNNLVEQRYKGESYLDVWLNSGAGQQFDFKNWTYFNENGRTGKNATNITTAYLIGGVLHNRNEMGMYLWGATMGKTNVGYTGLYLDNNIAHYIIEGNSDELQEMNTWRKGFLTMQKSDNINKYHNTFMYGAYGLHRDYKVQGVDPTKEGGIFYDNWKKLGYQK